MTASDILHTVVVGMAPPAGKIECPGCGKLLNDGRGYANYKCTCKEQQKEATNCLNLRRENLVKQTQAEEVWRITEPEELSVSMDEPAFRIEESVQFDASGDMEVSISTTSVITDKI